MIQALKGRGRPARATDGIREPRRRRDGSRWRRTRSVSQPKDLVAGPPQRPVDRRRRHRAHRSNPSDVVKAIVDAGNQRIDQAESTNGHLPQDKADALKAKVPQLADKFVNAKGGHAPGLGRSPRRSSSSTQSTSSSS